MANIQHKDILEADLHESKGVSTATVGQVYVTDGLGSGSFKNQSRYGEMYISGGATALALPAASAYTRLDPGTEWKAGISSGVTLTIADGTFTIVETGTYNISMWVVMSTAAIASGTRYFFKYAVNGTTVSRIISTQKVTNGVDYVDTSASGLAALTAGDVLSIYAAGDVTSSGTNIIVQEAGFTLHRT